MKNKKRNLPSHPAAPGRTRRPILGAILSLALGQGLYAQTAPAPAADEPKEDIVKIEKLVAEESVEDKALVLPTEPSRTVFGMSQSLAETPRSATVVPSSLLDSLGIRNSEDLIKIAPSSYSNFRFGLQGNISIRNQTSDFYFRGMRRIDPQGNFRTMWTANDSLEIVRGPSSPIFGLGRIGGYVNFNPKTARLANTGQYLTEPSGNVRITLGSFDKKIVPAEVGGPVDIPFLNKKGGYHVYVYDEDSKAFKVNNFDKQKLVQGTLSFNLNDSIRIETGGVYQHSNGGLPGGINRTTVDTISKLSYREQEKIARQIERLQKEVKIEQDAIAKLDGSIKYNKDEKVFIAQFTEMARLNIAALADLLNKIEAVEIARATPPPKTSKNES